MQGANSPGDVVALHAAAGVRGVSSALVMLACVAAVGCDCRRLPDDDAGLDASVDSGASDGGDAGGDAGLDASVDSGTGDGGDAGGDAGLDAGPGTDGGLPPPCAERPSDGVWATFRIPSPVPSQPPGFFRSLFTSPGGIASALDYWQRRAYPSVPYAALVCTPVPWNCGESWHQDPATAVINDTATEICDGWLPGADVVECELFRASSYGTYCPFAAELVELRDCRSEPSCPVAPR